MRERNNFYSIVKFQAVKVDASISSHRVPLERCSSAAGQFLPRHEVRVVLQFSDNNRVSAFDLVLTGTIITKNICDEVQSLSSVLRECNLLPVSTNKVSDTLTGSFISVCRLLSQLVGAAMDWCKCVQDEFLLSVPHRLRTLGRSPGVQIDEGLPITHGPTQDRELCANRVCVQCSIGM